MLICGISSQGIFFFSLLLNHTMLTLTLFPPSQSLSDTIPSFLYAFVPRNLAKSFSYRLFPPSLSLSPRWLRKANTVVSQGGIQGSADFSISYTRENKRWEETEITLRKAPTPPSHVPCSSVNNIEDDQPAALSVLSTKMGRRTALRTPVLCF